MSNTTGTSLAKESIHKSKNSRIKRLRKYTWGLGLEHEMQLFHKPLITTLKSNKPITEYIMFDSKKFLTDVLKNPTLSSIDKEFLEKIPFEETGRKCNGKVVLEKTPIMMPEIVTNDPFSSLESGKRPIESYINEMRYKEDILIKSLLLNDKVVKLQDKYGALTQYPFGMSSYFRYPTSVKSGKYTLSPIKRDYLGSYHITITLPFTEKTSLKSFISMHKNFNGLSHY
jgi:hypothetical protein